MTSFSLKDFHVSYADKTVLTQVNLPEIPAGKLVGLLGANGVGKSTLLRAVAGLGPYQGEACLDKENLLDLSRYQHMQKIGYMPQSLPQAISLTAYESVLSACRAVRPDLSTIAVETQIEAIFHDLDIRHLAFKTLASLSGGQRQMIGLAQILAKQPELLLLDEPTSALDLRWQLNVFTILRKYLAKQSGICLAALHDINLAMRHCDYIAILSDGALLTFGPPEEAINEASLARAYGVQAHVEISQSGHPFAIIHGPINPQ